MFFFMMMHLHLRGPRTLFEHKAVLHILPDSNLYRTENVP